MAQRLSISLHASFGPAGGVTCISLKTAGACQPFGCVCDRQITRKGESYRVRFLHCQVQEAMGIPVAHGVTSRTSRGTKTLFCFC